MLRRRELFRRQQKIVADHNEDSGLSRDIASIDLSDSAQKNGPDADFGSFFAERICCSSNSEGQKQTKKHTLTPTPQKKPAFSLPRLFQPKSSPKFSLKGISSNNKAGSTVPLASGVESITPAIADEAQPSPSTTTTSAYNTGGDTGQESPVERTTNNPTNIQVGQILTRNSSGTPSDKQHMRSSINAQRVRHTSPKISHQNSKNAEKQRVVRFAAPDLPNQMTSALFYTSAERLAETIAAQQRLLRQELYEEENGPIETNEKAKTQRDRKSTGDGTSGEGRKISQMRMSAENIAGKQNESTLPLPFPLPSSNTTQPQYQRHSRQDMQRRDGTPVIGFASSNSPAASALFGHRRHNTAENYNQIHPPDIAKANWPKPSELAELFAYKPPKQIRCDRRRSPSKQISGQIGNRQQQQAVAELEWIVKRRPDGTRYVTRRPSRKRGTPSMLAGVKARREASVQRERAGMSTTDDDGGSEVGAGTPKWWAQRRRKPPPIPSAYSSSTRRIPSSTVQQPIQPQQQQHWTKFTVTTV